LGTGFGGLSGPAIKPLIVRKVFQVAQRLQQVGKEVPLIGVGGIWSGSDVAEYLAAGATAVQLGTVLFADPLAPQRILREFTALRKAFVNDMRLIVASLGVDLAEP
jgi:dihydroorotate dehydrogenase (NAD+) catalytic subunit